MSELNISFRPELRRPVLVAAFRGWNDGGQGASLATGYLAKLWEAERFAEIDPENFFDFQATRPHVSLEEGLTRKIDWPATVFYHARPPGFDRDVVLLSFLFAIGYLAAYRDRSPALFKLGIGVLGLLLVQMAVGELQWRTKLPWGLVLGHVVLAAAVWAGTVALAALFFRPPRSLLPGQHLN